MRSSAERGAGFTLLEVIVSIAILGGVITALLVARSSAQETHLIAAQMLTATRLAASRAALLRAGALGPGEGELTEPSGYRWRVTAIPPAEGGRKDVRMYDLRVWPEAHEAEAGVSLHVWILDRTVEAAP